MSKLLTREELYKNACTISEKAGLKLFTELKKKRLLMFPNYDNKTYVYESSSQDECLEKLDYEEDDDLCEHFFCSGNKCSKF